MISVCIPVYNRAIAPLVNDLLHEINEFHLSVEIVVIDDCSAKELQLENQKSCKECTYIELEKNVGRAKIRNIFLNYAKNDCFLFLDCDSMIISPRFLRDYLEAISETTQVIVGASIYQSEQPNRSEMLRWKYSTLRESKSIQERKNANFNSFKTNNFLVHRTILERFPFNETIVGYGHEDTLFGFELFQNGIQIDHIENPVLNKYLDSNAVFLEKTIVGLKNLIHVEQLVHHDPIFISNIKLLRVYSQLKKKHFTGIVYAITWLISPILKLFLLKGVFTLWMFDMYKLHHFIKLKQ